MTRIELYTFETPDGAEFGSFTTQDLGTAHDYARANGLRLLARIFEYDHTEEVEDYSPAPEEIETP